MAKGLLLAFLPMTNPILDTLLAIHPGISFSADVSGSKARIEHIRVPDRRNGLGSLVYRAWESGLVPGTEVSAVPVDDDAAAFWRALGFADHGSCVMVRVVPSSSGISSPDAA